MAKVLAKKQAMAHELFMTIVCGMKPKKKALGVVNIEDMP